MRIITIKENSGYALPENEVPFFKEFLESNKDLPVTLNGNTLIFEAYIVGSITVKNTSIVIEPRISKFTPNHYFEMQLFNEGLLNNDLSSLLSENEGFGIQENLISLFLQETFELVVEGVEGAFLKVQEKSGTVKGKILIEEISPLDLMQGVVPVEYEIHTRSTSFNKIIKLALMKLPSIISREKQNKLHSLVSAYFENIDVAPSDLPVLLLENEYKLYYENSRYPTVIGLAKKILNDLKLNMKNSEVLGIAYLVNSNSLFENYVRKVLSLGLKTSVTKWAAPKNMGQFVHQGVPYIKSYIPDILLDYRTDSNVALAVLDAKNKDISNPQHIGSLADLYQILFYSYSLNSTFGGLVYPCYGDYRATRISIESFKESNIFAFFVDFEKSIKNRNDDFIKQIKSTFRIE